MTDTAAKGGSVTQTKCATTATIETSFYSGIPDDLKVGDRLEVGLVLTVASITADVVDITSLGQERTFTIGDLTVKAIENTHWLKRVTDV